MSGYIYILGTTSLQLAAKVGYSKNPHERARQVQAYCPLPLRLLTTIPGTKSNEAALHEHLVADWLHGEWFSMGPTLRAWLARLAAEKPLNPWALIPPAQWPEKRRWHNGRSICGDEHMAQLQKDVRT